LKTFRHIHNTPLNDEVVVSKPIALLRRNSRVYQQTIR
jgi:hypothetical protein